MVVKHRNAGFTLIETMLAVAVLSVLILGLAIMLLGSAKGLVKSREQVRAQRLARNIHVNLQSMNFFDIHSCDSSLPEFGLTSVGLGGLHSAPYGPAPAFSYYPSSATLLTIDTATREAGFSRFDLSVAFLRRDRSAIRAANVTTNLIPFTDTDKSQNPTPPPGLAAYTVGDGFDDFDPMIRYRDINGDGAYFSRYFLGGANVMTPLPAGCAWLPLSWCNAASICVMGCLNRADLPFGTNWSLHTSLTEMPDTRLKQVTLRLWNKRGDLVHREGWVLSEGGYTGNEIEDWESVLSLDVQQPVSPTVLYQSITLTQQTSLGLAITLPYPVTPAALRADVLQPLIITGYTAALANVFFTTAPASGLFTSMDSAVADADGVFSLPASNITNVLVEGENTLGGVAEKNGDFSPIWSVPLIYDTRPPNFSGEKPLDNSDPIRTLSPFLGVKFIDDVPTIAVSGISKEVLYVSTRVGAGPTSPTGFLFRDGWSNYGNDWVVVASTESGLIGPLVDNQWVEVNVEGGDNARYKAKFSWKVKIDIDNGDASSPTIKMPISMADGCSVIVTGQVPVITCELNDPDSGIDWRTIHLTVTPGNIPVPSLYVADVSLLTTPRMGDYFDPQTIQTGGTLTYTFPAALPLGPYCLTVYVENWNGIPSVLPDQLFGVP
jgi:prepilin-type N-terminal cleavage/methylation domain-containing protein